MKTVMITGCNGGLGKALLEKFVEEGCDIVACVYPEDEDFNAYCHQIKIEKNVDIKILSYDSTDRTSLQLGIETIEKLESSIDVLVNSAGISIIKPIFNVEYDDLVKIFSINYFATVMITKAVVGKMMRQENGGNIVNISSMVSLGSQPGGTCYDATKAALNQFTKTLAQELAGFNIRVNAIAPAPMNTAMFKGLTEKTQRNALKGIAMKRPAELAEVVEVASFLASEKASFITGEIIKVDGGAIV